MDVTEKARKLLALVALLTAPTTAAMAAGPENPSEYDVKAAYLFNFAKFIKWKSGLGPGNDFTICVLGSDPFGETLQRTVAGESVEGHSVKTRRVRAVTETTGCSIVFISTSERPRIRAAVPQLASRGVLTVSDLDDFVDQGGMIQFVLEDNRVRFKVNLDAATKAGLTLSSELLKVASSVKRDQGE